MRYFYDVVVVGSGIAGLSAGIMLKEHGLNTVVIIKEEDICETATNYAQGGIIAWEKNDTPRLLGKDILHAGCRLNNADAVRLIADEGPWLVFNFLMDKVGIDFSRNTDGELDYTEEAAHSRRRILHFPTIQESIFKKPWSPMRKRLGCLFLGDLPQST